MRLTRVIAIGVMASSMALSAFTMVQAQNLRNAGPPAEFPPESFKGNQYVDSRGCIYIRAGIDGYTTWVPRVTRNRKVVCGYKPSLPPGTQVATAPPRTQGVEQITLPPESQPTATAPSAQPRATASATTAPTAPSTPPASGAGRNNQLSALLGLNAPPPSPGPEPTVFENPPVETKPAPQPAPVQTASVRTTPPRAPSPGPEPTVFNTAPEPVAAPAPVAVATATTTRPARVRTTRTPSPGPEPTVFNNDPAPSPAPTPAPQPQAVATANPACTNASALSQRYINDGSRHPVRCGPQSEAPVTYRTTAAAQVPQTTTVATAPTAATVPVATGTGTQVAAVSNSTRVVPRHVYDNRQNTQNVAVPKGYQTVWEDGRLNPKRAERTLAPYQPEERSTLPPGYRIAWEDGRLNPNRGQGTAAGNAQTQQIWTNTLPRQLQRVPTDRQIVRNPNPQNPGLPRARNPSRSEQATVQQPARTQPVATQPGKRRFIRVAAYNTDADARASAQALARRTGLSIRLGTLHRKGKTYRVVMAGPFTTDASAQSAMAKVRGAGFANAKLSK
ncbi:MAG: SPOR domain-containing protein [Paracoccaceae bacterium]